MAVVVCAWPSLELSFLHGGGCCLTRLLCSPRQVPSPPWASVSLGVLWLSKPLPCLPVTLPLF